MEKTTLKIVLVLIVSLAILWIVAGSGPVPFGNSPWHRRTAFSVQLGSMGHICHKLRDYSYKHPNIKAAEMAGRTISDYVAMGVLAPEDAIYIRDHHIVFHGFDPNKIGGDIPVLEALYTESPPPRRIVAYSDASATFFGWTVTDEA